MSVPCPEATGALFFFENFLVVERPTEPTFQGHGLARRRIIPNALKSGYGCVYQALVGWGSIRRSTAGLAMPCENAHPAGVSPLVAGKKLEACGGCVGKDDTFTQLAPEAAYRPFAPTQIFMLEWHDEKSWIIRFNRTGGRRDRW